MLALALVAWAACISVPGDTKDEQRANIDAYAQESIDLLVKQTPEARAELDAAAGWTVLRQRDVKIPIFGVAGGWGVVVERESGKHTYMKLRRFDVGAGWGVRVTRLIAVLKTPEAVKDALGGGFDFKIGAEAGAKAGDVGGGAAGGGTSKGSEDVKVYVLLESGVSATATVGLVRVSQLGSLNER